MTKLAADPALDADFVKRMFEDASGTLWIAGLQALWSWRDRLVRVKGPRPPFFVETLAQVRATGAVFAGTARGRTGSIPTTAVLVRPYSATSGAPVWADADGLWTVDGQDVLRDGRRVFTLPERRIVSAALFDREGSLWLGTDAGGLHRLKPALFTTYSVPEGVGHPNVYATYVDRSGAIWLGTWGKRCEPRRSRHGSHNDSRRGDDLRSVNSFYEDATGTLWIATGVGAGGVSVVCTPPAMSCRADGPRELRGRAVFALYGDADGGVWAGAAGLLFRYDGQELDELSPVIRSAGGHGARVREHARRRAVDGDQRRRPHALPRRDVHSRHAGRWAAERPDSIALPGCGRVALGWHGGARPGAARSARVGRGPRHQEARHRPDRHEGRTLR